MAGRKGERTRRSIVERAAPVFNTKGYHGTSMSDLVRETGLEKGGIYGHFAGKEELALAAFDHAAGLMRERLRVALEGEDGALGKLLGVVGVFGGLAEDPPVAGGCAILNTAIESDDTNPALKQKASDAAAEWLRLVGGLVKEGVRGGELDPDADPRLTASIVVSTLEGALMLAKLQDDPTHMGRAVQHLESHLRSLAPLGEETEVE